MHKERNTYGKKNNLSNFHICVFISSSFYFHIYYRDLDKSKRLWPLHQTPEGKKGLQKSKNKSINK